MTHTIENILLPSLGVEIVFNLNSLTPSSKPSIIYDVDHLGRTCIVAQPLIPIRPDTLGKEIHLTMLITDNGAKKRFGIKCRPIKFDDHYPLSNNKTVGAITFEYDPGMIETTIRSAFRLNITKEHGVKAKLWFQGKSYYTNDHFSFRDISLAGVGIVIPRSVKGVHNPLAGVTAKDRMDLGIILRDDKKSGKKLVTISSVIEILRTNTNFSPTQTMAGARFLKFKTASNEEDLSRFIHRAQMEDLKRLSGI